jgi:hypothetical protein
MRALFSNASFLQRVATKKKELKECHSLPRDLLGCLYMVRVPYSGAEKAAWQIFTLA